MLVEAALRSARARARERDRDRETERQTETESKRETQTERELVESARRRKELGIGHLSIPKSELFTVRYGQRGVKRDVGDAEVVDDEGTDVGL